MKVHCNDYIRYNITQKPVQMRCNPWHWCEWRFVSKEKSGRKKKWVAKKKLPRFYWISWLLRMKHFSLWPFKPMHLLLSANIFLWRRCGRWPWPIIKCCWLQCNDARKNVYALQLRLLHKQYNFDVGVAGLNGERFSIRCTQINLLAFVATTS